MFNGRKYKFMLEKTWLNTEDLHLFLHKDNTESS